MRRQTKLGSRLVAGLTAGALMVGGWPATSRAEEPPFEVDLEVVADRVMAAKIQMRIGGSRGLVLHLLSAYLVEWRRLHPADTGLEMGDHMTNRFDQLNDTITHQDMLLADAELALRLVSELMAIDEGPTAASPHIRDLVGTTLGRSVAAFDTREDLVSGSLRGARWIRGQSEVEARLWSDVRRQAQTDPAFAFAWDQLLAYAQGYGPAPFSVSDSLLEMMADPLLEAHVDMDALLAQQGSREEFLAEARRQFDLVAMALAAESQQARERLAQQSAACPVSTDTACTPEQRATAAATAKAEQKQIDAAAAAGKLLGGLARIADQKSGEKIEKVANAWFAIISATNKYFGVVSDRNATDTAITGARLVLAGDVLGAVMTLVGLLGESGPSLDQQILQQVAAIRQEVRALRQEMRESFLRIEVALDTIFAVMLNEFDKLGAAIAGNTAALISVQNALAEQELRLESVAATILTAIGDVELHDARADVNQYIGYADTYGEPIPSYGEYIGPENEFHYAGTEIATHTAFVVPPSLAADPSVDPAAILNSYGESGALSYLARLARYRDPRVPDPTSVYANPSVWNFAAQAYALLQVQNPGLAAQVAPSRSAQIALEGHRILDVTRSFSRPAAQPDPSGDRTNPIFTTLVSEYRNALVYLGNRMGAIRKQEFEKREEPIDPQGSSYQPVVKNYGLFASANQFIPESTLPPDPALLGKCHPDAWNPLISRPTNVAFKTLVPALRLAHYAYSPTMEGTTRLPEMSQCYEAAFLDHRAVTTPLYTAEFAKLELVIHTRFRWAHTPGAPSQPDETWLSARSASYTWPEMAISYNCNSHCQGGWYTSVEEALLSRWGIDKAKFQQSAILHVDQGLAESAQTRMEAFLNGRRRAYYQRVAAEIHNANTPLNLAAADMDTAARQLQAYTRLGFPIALSSDDILTSLLFGQRSLPVNMTGNPQLDRTYDTAYQTYGCDPGASLGTPCFGGPFNPLEEQPHLDVETSPNGPTYCAAQTWSWPGLPGDPVGNCLVGGAHQRLEALSGRYRHHSQLQFYGHREWLPWISSTLTTLGVVDKVVRTAPAP